MIEQIADSADDQLDRARRQDLRLDHDLERGFAEIGGRRGRLHDRRHAREDGRRQQRQDDVTQPVERIRAEIARTSGTALAPQQLDAALHDLAAMGLLEPTPAAA